MGSSQKASEENGVQIDIGERPLRQRAARLPAGERRAAILKEAAVFFSEQGFAASTRDLADRLGVRQALLYKYYTSKEALLEAIFEAVFASHWTLVWAETLGDRDRPLGERISDFYVDYLGNTDGIGLRLVLRAALDGWHMPNRLIGILNEKFFCPLIAELRHDGNFPDLDRAPALQGEYELVVMLYGAVLFYRMRADIYRLKVASDLRAVIDLYVTTFLDGAHGQMKALHNGHANADLLAHA